jgi:hypothetical protein
MSTNPQKARAELSKQAKEEQLKQNLQKTEPTKEKELSKNIKKTISKIEFIKQNQPKKS